jgi:hypothetical protein
MLQRKTKTRTWQLTCFRHNLGLRLAFYCLGLDYFPVALKIRTRKVSGNLIYDTQREIVLFVMFLSSLYVTLVTEKNEPSSSGITSFLGICALIFAIIMVAILLTMGWSSVATEPNPIFGNDFPLVMLLLIVVLSIVFFLGIEVAQRRK